jgi:hypothetical protein
MVVDVMLSHTRHVLHSDELWLELYDEPLEIVEQRPVIGEARVTTFVVAGERLTGRASSQQTHRALRPALAKFGRIKFRYVAQQELGALVVRFKGIPACRVEINTGYYTDARPLETVSQAADAAKKIDCLDWSRQVQSHDVHPFVLG